MSLLVEDLRSNVVWRAAERLLALAVVFDTRSQAEVANLDVQVVIQEEIAELEIAVDDFVVVEVFDPAHDLVDVVAALVLGNDLSALVQLHHGALLAQLEDDVHVEGIVEEAMEADNVLVEERFVDLNLLGHLLLLIVLHHQLLRDDLAGEGFIGCYIYNLIAFGESSLRNDEL